MKNSQLQFRAWDIKAKIMKQVINLFIDENMVQCDKDEYSVYNASNYKIMQFTGILDKNKIKIYEGDILEWTIFPSHFNYKTMKDESLPKKRIKDYISFSNGCFICTNRKELLFTKEPHRNVTIIGNIYENSELLKLHNREPAAIKD